MAHLRPFGVDVSTRGWRSSPGRKDPLKVRDFIVNARAAASDVETRDPLAAAPGDDEPYDWRDA